VLAAFGVAVHHCVGYSLAMTRFLIIDDHPLFREALQSAVMMAFSNVETVEARSISEAVSSLNVNAEFDLALLDLNMPGIQGFEGLRQLRTLFPRLPVVVVSGHEEARIITEALSYGVAGFIPKSFKKSELAGAIQEVINGSVFVPPGYELQPGPDSNKSAVLSRLATLTPQQLRVLQMIKQGMLNKQIAYELKVGETTIKAHVSEILRKLNVFSRTQAVIEVSKIDAVELFRDDAHTVNMSALG
jgi:DNA-binding NarL/FixJ family response regulator